LIYDETLADIDPQDNLEANVYIQKSPRAIICFLLYLGITRNDLKKSLKIEII
jgi:hypothetical protein